MIKAKAALLIQHRRFYLTGVYAVIDLYGQCAQVTITSGSGVRPAENRLSVCTADIDPSLTSPLSAGLITIVFTEFIARNYKNDEGDFKHQLTYYAISLNVYIEKDQDLKNVLII